MCYVGYFRGEVNRVEGVRVRLSYIHTLSRVVSQKACACWGVSGNEVIGTASVKPWRVILQLISVNIPAFEVTITAAAVAAPYTDC